MYVYIPRLVTSMKPYLDGFSFVLSPLPPILLMEVVMNDATKVSALARKIESAVWGETYGYLDSEEDERRGTATRIINEHLEPLRKIADMLASYRGRPGRAGDAEAEVRSLMRDA